MGWISRSSITISTSARARSGLMATPPAVDSGVILSPAHGAKHSPDRPVRFCLGRVAVVPRSAVCAGVAVASAARQQRPRRYRVPWRPLRKYARNSCTGNGGTKLPDLACFVGVVPTKSRFPFDATSVVPRLIDAPVCGSVCATASMLSGGAGGLPPAHPRGHPAARRAGQSALLPPGESGSSSAPQTSTRVCLV